MLTVAWQSQSMSQQTCCWLADSKESGISWLCRPDASVVSLVTVVDASWTRPMFTGPGCHPAIPIDIAASWRSRVMSLE
jgi:hypothetical protein